MAKFNTLFSHSVSKGLSFTQPSLTEQCFGYETDINNIVKRGVQTSLPPNTQRPIFGSEFNPDSYSEALNIVSDAKSKFEQLPSHVRREFNDDPKKLIEFVSDESNYEKALKLGLVNKRPEKVEDTTQPVVKPQPEVTGQPVIEVSSQ